MNVEVKKSINASGDRVWKIISDINGSADVISGIEKIEVLENPSDGLVGLKWRETRTMFGKEATEVMWITDAEENASYQTRAESHGSIYVTKLQITDEGEGCVLAMSFEGTPQTFGAKLMWALTGFMARSSMKKALEKDLQDIKTAAEQ